jgi:subtilisin family serine protease
VNTPGALYVVTVSGSSGNTIAPGADVYVSVPFPSDPLYSNQWGPSDLNLPNAWAKTLGTNKLIIAIADSGIWFDHPDLKNNLWTASDGSHGINFVGSTATDLSNCVPTSTNAADDYGHGTAVAGVIGGAINNGVGIVG